MVGKHASKAVVDLVPKPRKTVIAVGHFTSVLGAIEATEDALACDPAAVEMMDRTILDLSRQKIEYADLGRTLIALRGADQTPLHAHRKDRRAADVRGRHDVRQIRLREAHDAGAAASDCGR